MTKLTPCTSCHRHCRNTEISCPFCGVRRIAIAAGVTVLATLAMACDGPSAQTPTSNAVIPEPSVSASASSVPTVSDAGSVATTPTTAPTASETRFAVPAYGMPPPRIPDNNR